MKHHNRHKKYRILSVLLAALVTASLAACGSDTSGQTGEAAAATASASAQEGTSAPTSADTSDMLTEDDITVSETLTSTADSEHVITADGTSASYSNIKVTKSGDSDSGDEADFYGDNAAIFATDGATLDLSGIAVITDGLHANAVFSYGEGTTVNISSSYIETSGNCSGGLMTTGGGTMNAYDLTVTTSGNSSAAIRSDRGGGDVNVSGGYYTTSGKGSPVIYSTADITVENAVLISTASQGVVVEGKNSVTLKDVTLTADNNTKNSNKSSWYQAVMIYQSMSGDAAQGLSSFTMEGGTLTNVSGDIFFVTNTATEIRLTGAEIINQDADGVFLRAAAAGWGSDGSNGGQVSLYASQQTIDGDMIVDDISVLNLYLSDGSTFTGAINGDGAAGDVYVALTGGSKWVLTGDSYITSLSCDADAIDLNGYTLYVNGTAYTAGTSSTGEAVEITVSSSSGSGSHANPPSKPD